MSIYRKVRKAEKHGAIAGATRYLAMEQRGKQWATGGHESEVAGAIADAWCKAADKSARKARGYFHEESSKGFRGEPYERVMAYYYRGILYWMDGEPISPVDAAALESALRSAEPAVPPAGTGPSRYIQLPPLRVWGVPVEGGPAEPLDGWFAFRGGNALSVLAIFGLHPGRAGFTAVEVGGLRPTHLERADRSALFAGALPGAERAGLASIVGAEELLELAWRLSS